MGLPESLNNWRQLYVGDISRLVPTIAVSFILGLWFHHEGAVSLQSTKNRKFTQLSIQINTSSKHWWENDWMHLIPLIYSGKLFIALCSCSVVVVALWRTTSIPAKKKCTLKLCKADFVYQNPIFPKVFCLNFYTTGHFSPLGMLLTLTANDKPRG